MRRANDQALSAWRSVLANAAALADELRPASQTGFQRKLRRWKTAGGGLPTGIIHADLFPDNAFFADGAISGVIDFYFACNDALAFDIAICLNAWCFDNGTLCPDRAEALTGGYETVRPLEPAEKTAFRPCARRGDAFPNHAAVRLVSLAGRRAGAAQGSAGICPLDRLPPGCIRLHRLRGKLTA